MKKTGKGGIPAIETNLSRIKDLEEKDNLYKDPELSLPKENKTKNKKTE